MFVCMSEDFLQGVPKSLVHNVIVDFAHGGDIVRSNCQDRSTVTPKTLSITNPNSSVRSALPNTRKMSLCFGGVVNSTYSWLEYCSLSHVISFTQSRDMGILKQQVHGKGFFTCELITRILFKTFYNCHCLLIQTKIDM